MPDFGTEQEDTIEAPAGAMPGTEADEEEFGGEEPEGEAGDGDEQEGEEQGEGEGAADLEEVEYEGERYAIPTKLKDAFLRQADYTRKTQALGEDRRQVEAAREAIVAQHQALEQDREDLGKLASIDGQIKHYQQYTQAQWDQYHETNPIEAQKLWRHFQSLKESRGEVVAGLEKRAIERRETTARDFANRTAKALSELQRDIPGFSPQVAGAITEFGISQGYTREELQGLADSRPIKILHKAMLYDQLMAKQGGAQRVKTTPPAAVKPLKQVSKGASRPAATSEPSDKDDIETWVRKMDAKERRKRQQR